MQKKKIKVILHNIWSNFQIFKIKKNFWVLSASCSYWPDKLKKPTGKKNLPANAGQ